MKSQKAHPGKLRLLIQLGWAALTNGYIKGFAKGQIFTGTSKYLCLPGMNCYSCPGALGSCPIGSLQATLNAREFKLSLYVLGLLAVFGTLLGRFVCGFLCPFGLIQDLLFKIPFVKKLRRLPGEKGLRWLRFIFLGVFVILLPMFVIDITGLGEPWFCKWICPVGTLEGGIPLVLLNNAMRGAAGFLFRWKLLILAITLLLSIIIYRPFCRYVCPLGAVYGLFNKISFYRIKIDSEKCVSAESARKPVNSTSLYGKIQTVWTASAAGNVKQRVRKMQSLLLYYYNSGAKIRMSLPKNLMYNGIFL